MDLKQISTEDLINELESRPGIKKISVGPYKSYELRRKYTAVDRDPIEADAVLLIGSCQTTANEKQEWRRFMPISADKELLSTLIGKKISTHYNTGGIVTNVVGPHNAYGPGSWTINYTEDGKKNKNPCIINSIKIENGIITCDGKPLQIIGQEESTISLNTEQTYIYRGLV